MPWQTNICWYANNAEAGKPECLAILRPYGGGQKGHLDFMILDNLYFAHYSHHFIIPANPGQYPAISNGTSAPRQVELEATYEDDKKLYNTAITMEAILGN